METFLHIGGLCTRVSLTNGISLETRFQNKINRCNILCNLLSPGLPFFPLSLSSFSQCLTTYRPSFRTLSRVVLAAIFSWLLSAQRLPLTSRSCQSSCIPSNGSTKCTRSSKSLRTSPLLTRPTATLKAAKKELPLLSGKTSVSSNLFGNALLKSIIDIHRIPCIDKNTFFFFHQ